MTEHEAIFEIARVLVKLWYDPEQPFNHQREVYNLVCKITRDLLGLKEETYERALIERDATVALCQHYRV